MHSPTEEIEASGVVYTKDHDRPVCTTVEQLYDWYSLDEGITDSSSIQANVARRILNLLKLEENDENIINLFTDPVLQERLIDLLDPKGTRPEIFVKLLRSFNGQIETRDSQLQGSDWENLKKYLHNDDCTLLDALQILVNIKNRMQSSNIPYDGEILTNKAARILRIQKGVLSLMGDNPDKNEMVLQFVDIYLSSIIDDMMKVCEEKVSSFDDDPDSDHPNVFLNFIQNEFTPLVSGILPLTDSLNDVGKRGEIIQRLLELSLEFKKHHDDELQFLCELCRAIAVGHRSICVDGSYDKFIDSLLDVVRDNIKNHCESAVNGKFGNDKLRSVKECLEDLRDLSKRPFGCFQFHCKKTEYINGLIDIYIDELIEEAEEENRRYQESLPLRAIS